MNILDYLSWRNDVPFTISKFNEVDSLILSELAYIDFEKIVESSSISLQDVNDEFFLHHNREEIEEKHITIPTTLFKGESVKFIE